MDSTDTPLDYTDNPDEDCIVLIGDKGGLAMKSGNDEVDEKINSGFHYY